MTPSRPYFVRAVYDWLNDNDQTPYLLVDATRAGVQVPAAFVKDGRIVLNAAPGAVRELFIHNDAVSFSARFGGVPMQVYVPMAALLAIYSRENGQGMFFEGDDDYPEDAPAVAPVAGPVLATVAVTPRPSAVPAAEGAERTGMAGGAEDAGEPGGSTESAGDKAGEGDDRPEPPRPGGGRPSLRVVK